MTDMVTTTSTTTDTHEEGTLEHLDPQHLVLELNVRSDAGLTDDFLASITEHGVLVPIVAVRTPDGTTLVRAGQRRTLAAPSPRAKPGWPQCRYTCGRWPPAATRQH